LDAVADPTDDYTELTSLIQQLPPAIRNLPERNGDWPFLHLPVTLQEFAAYHRTAHGFAFPIGEVLAEYEINDDGSMERYKTPRTISDAITAGVRNRVYAQISVPILVFSWFPPTVAIV
jgi:hypothetical protein